MKRRLSALGLAAGLLLAGGTGEAAQSSRTVTANTGARIITAISITKLVDLEFKDIVPGAAAGTVVMSPAGVRTSTGGATLGTGVGSSPASFRVSGQPSARFAIVLPNSVAVSNGVQTMTVNTFRRAPGGAGNLGAGGAQTISVGATCRVAANQAGGTYTGNFNVTVTYN
ncbi:MAG: DUF4402 domain-containing protein [Acidobacteriota bacterium]